MIRHLRRLARNERGAAIIELALVAPVFASVIIGVIDLTTAFNRKLELEQAVQRSIERVMQTTAETTVEANIKAEAAAAAGIGEDQVIVNYTLTCAGVVKPYDQDCSTGEAEVRYIRVSASDDFTPIFPLSRIGLTGDHFTLTAETGIRTQ